MDGESVFFFIIHADVKIIVLYSIFNLWEFRITKLVVDAHSFSVWKASFVQWDRVVLSLCFMFNAFSHWYSYECKITTTIQLTPEDRELYSLQSEAEVSFAMRLLAFKSKWTIEKLVYLYLGDSIAPDGSTSSLKDEINQLT